MKQINYIAQGAILLNDTGRPAQVGDTVKLFLDTEANPDFPEFILGVIQHPITSVQCNAATSYVIEYNEDDLEGSAPLIRASDVVDVTLILATDILEIGLDNEIAARIAGDVAEAAARTAAILVETNARIAADAAEVTARNAAILVETNARIAADALKANIASPTFTGVPAASTAAPGTSTTQLATTAFVVANQGTAASELIGIPKNASFVMEGDSITSGSPSYPGETAWPAFAATLTSFRNRGALTVKAVSGSALSNMVARYVADVRPLRPAIVGGEVWLIVLIGTNDIASGAVTSAGGPAAWVDLLEAYVATAKTDGFKVAVCTILPVSNRTTIDQEVNQEIRISTVPDVVIELSDVLSNPSNAELFTGDGLHLKTAGAKVLAEQINQEISKRIFTPGRKEIILRQRQLGIHVDQPLASFHATDALVHLRGGDSQTVNTTKVMRVAVEPYANPATTPWYAFTGVSSSGNNRMQIGGGSSSGYAATNIDFYLGATTSTLTGTLTMSLANGRLSIGDTTVGTSTLNLTVAGAGIRLSQTTAAQQTSAQFALAATGGSVATNSISGDLVIVAPSAQNISFGVATVGNTQAIAMILKQSGILHLVPATTPTYADNAAAVTGGLVAGDVYKTATGELRIRI